jgi:hypothetical protein
MLADTKTRDLMKLDDLQQLALYCTNYLTPEILVRKLSFFLVDMARLFQTDKKLVKKIATQFANELACRRSKQYE